MPSLRVIWVAGLFALIFCASAYAAFRINGNQLVEGAGDFTFGREARASAAADPQSVAPVRMITNLGQGVVAKGSLPDSSEGIAMALGVGLAYDIVTVVFGQCPVALSGDIDENGQVSMTDVVILVNYIYKDGTPPLPCLGTGDINCSGNITAADCTQLINYMFKGGPPPCDICDLIKQGVWTCR